MNQEETSTSRSEGRANTVIVVRPSAVLFIRNWPARAKNASVTMGILVAIFVIVNFLQGWRNPVSDLALVAVAITIGLVMAVPLWAAYFLRASIEVGHGKIRRTGLFSDRTYAASEVGVIVRCTLTNPYRRVARLVYVLNRAGQRLFAVPPMYWRESDIARLAAVLNVPITGDYGDRIPFDELNHRFPPSS